MLNISPDREISKTLKRQYIHGLRGLAELIGCSYQTAHKIKNSGKIPFAKIGKKFIFDEQKVIDALTQTRKESTSV